MGIEIERKFLVKDDSFRKMAKGTRYRQGYLHIAPECAVRVRTIEDKGFLTVKGISIGATRVEYEYEIPVQDAAAMLAELCEKPIIEKKRYKIKAGNHTWEVDEFFGENEGLVIAELELGNEAQPYAKPAWIGNEVTDDPKYFNSNLIRNPYKSWQV